MAKSLNKEQICRTLESHGIPFYEENERIYADKMISNTAVFENVDDVTDFNEKKLREWLGY